MKKSMPKCIVTCLVTLVIVACGQFDISRPFNSQAPDSRALAALAQFGADVPATQRGRCAGCHEVNRKAKYKQWIAQTRSAKVHCLDNGDLPTVRERINCLRVDPANEASDFSGLKLGVFRAGVHLNDFENVFAEAYGRFVGPIYHREFKEDMQMPRNASAEFRMTREQFDFVVAWILEDAPGIDTVLSE